MPAALNRVINSIEVFFMVPPLVMVYLVPVVLEEPDVPLPVAPEELSVEPDEPDEPDAPDDPLEPDAPDALVVLVALLEPDDVPAAGGQSALAVEPGPAEALAPAGPQSALLEPVVPVDTLAPLELVVF